MEKSKIIKELHSLLNMKLKYFRAFYDTSLQQKKIVTQYENEQSQKKAVRPIDSVQIEKLLLKKDNIISKITELEKHIEYMFKNNLSLESELIGDTIAKSFDRQIKETVDKIIPVEKEVAAMLEQHKNILKEHVGTVRRGKVLISGYGGQKFIGPRFVDYKLQ